MPIYEYLCSQCGHHLEALQKLSDEPLVFCPECSEAALKKQVSAAAFRLKGTGWYETDFKDSKKEKSSSAKGSSSDSGTSSNASSDSEGASTKSSKESSKSSSDKKDSRKPYSSESKSEYNRKVILETT